ncbi:MAG: nitroreductase family protein [Bacteroidales bacterium]|nr:nitroreductase family protein [Bacteroidales bacterium]
MDFQQLIHSRESIRNFNPHKPIGKETLERILEAGRIAPSAANRQPWRFYLISTEKNLAKIRSCYGRSWFMDAPHVLVVAGKYSLSWMRTSDGYNSLETDLAIAMTHLVLAAEAEGVGTCWIAAFNADELKKSGLFEKDEHIFAMTPLGYPNEGFKKNGLKNRKLLREVVVYL